MTSHVTITLEHNAYLQDHTIGRGVSAKDAGLLALPVVPLTFSMELMAEAAAALLPGILVTGMREVRAYRWIALDPGRIDLVVTAQRKVDGRPSEVNVVIREATTAAGPEARPKLPLIEGTILLDTVRTEATISGRCSLPRSAAI